MFYTSNNNNCNGHTFGKKAEYTESKSHDGLIWFVGLFILCALGIAIYFVA